MKEKTLLQNTSEVLKTLGFETASTTKAEDGSFEVAIVPMGSAKDGGTYVMQVVHYTPPSAPDDEKTSAPPVLAFSIVIATGVQETRLSEVIRMMLLANKSLPFGSFNFSELERAVYFSYGIPVADGILTRTTLASILQMILFAKETFFPLIQDLVEGKKSLENLINEQGG